LKMRSGGRGRADVGEIGVLAPRNDWLVTRARNSRRRVLKVALQMRRNRNGDNPVYAWTCGLLAAVCDPDKRVRVGLACCAKSSR